MNSVPCTVALDHNICLVTVYVLELVWTYEEENGFIKDNIENNGDVHKSIV